MDATPRHRSTSAEIYLGRRRSASLEAEPGCARILTAQPLRRDRAVGGARPEIQAH
jgi:hypothetical protein